MALAAACTLDFDRFEGSTAANSGGDASGGTPGAGAGKGGTAGAGGVEDGQPLGAACDTFDECESGYCVDSVCCESSCDEQCQMCNVDASGSCSDVELVDDCETPGHLCSSAGMCACGLDPAPVGGDCPAVCTGGCEPATTCVIDCSGPAACQGQALNCPPGFDCLVQCKGGACKEANALCPADHHCELTCGNNACDGVTLTCSQEGTCAFSCLSCSGANVHCGDDACVADCGGGQSSVTCNNSCGCNVTACDG